MANETGPLATVGSWLQAARPAAQANLFFPIAYGEALAFAQRGSVNWATFAAAHAFGILAQLAIVFANDAADWRSDARNTTFNMYSGGSRVVSEGKLTPRQLLGASVLATVGLAGVCAWFALSAARPGVFAVLVAAIALMWAYSFAPLRLSYRGHGEVLQATGLGVVLPAFGFYAQAGNWELGWTALLAPSLLGYAGNITTALPDYPSDEATGKRTLVVRYGELRARWASLLLIGTAILCGPALLPRTPIGDLQAIPQDALIAGHSARHLLLAVALPLTPILINALRVRRAEATNRKSCFWFVTLNGLAMTGALVAWITLLLTSNGGALPTQPIALP